MIDDRSTLRACARIIAILIGVCSMIALVALPADMGGLTLARWDETAAAVMVAGLVVASVVCATCPASLPSSIAWAFIMTALALNCALIIIGGRSSISVAVYAIALWTIWRVSGRTPR